MDAADAARAGPAAGAPAPLGLPTPSDPGGLLDVLGVAAVVLDAAGRIALWSPQAEELFGWTAEEALGSKAARLMVAPDQLDLVLGLFGEVMSAGETWAGVFPIRHRDGSTRPVEFRNMRLQDRHGAFYALGIAADEATVRDVERDLALSVRMVAQSPIGLAVLDADLRYIMVNPALARINGLPVEGHVGRSVHDALPMIDPAPIDAVMHEVLATGRPRLNHLTVGRTSADPDHDHAWSVSYFRLEDRAGRILGLATSVIDVTEQHRSGAEAAAARRRLALIARASARIGSTLDLDTTARELAELVVPQLADVAAVDVLDAVLEGAGPGAAPPIGGPAAFRALALAATHTSEGVRAAVRAADPTGSLARYPADRLVARCVATGEPVLVAHVGPEDLPEIARDAQAADVLAEAGLRSYLAVPLIARGEVLGALDLKRIRNAPPFDDDDVLLALELASRAAVCIDNARWYQNRRHAALTLQRHLLPRHRPKAVGLDLAYRYQPKGARGEAGGDWFDAVPQAGDRSALVVGDVMGSGINAAATMGQLRTATRTLAGLELDPAQVLRHLDRTMAEIEESMATCVYADYDPATGQCRIALAGHPPPVLVRRGRAPELLDLPTGAPLGVGGVPFESTALDLAAGDRLVLYTDGLVETREEPLDDRLATLLDLLADPGPTLEETCDLLLAALRRPDGDDDVALLIAEVAPPADPPD
ncbi:SpoIIE family protein phosphatase [Kitasatospora sp. NPDC059571]|uniref:SpoIIE family protein phosphatase n=1 Tax=Kitasatospora sp. NPDC059571 TaxID=3346871 RepID=UPI00367D4964